MKHTYYCVSCGEEIKPEQIAKKTMVSLSCAALDGANDTTINKIPVYVTRETIEKLINRTDEEGRQYLTLSEYLGFAYNNNNRKDLDETKAADARTALEIYHASLKPAAAETDSEASEEESEESDLTNDDAYDAEYRDSEEPEQEIVIPGFSETATAQIIKNFPNDICYLEWRINDTSGYFYFLTEKTGAKKNITPYWVCAKCKDEILVCAFENRHILIGLLGFPSAGKTCMIAAFCHTMMEQGGVLTATKATKGEYQDLLADFSGGYSLAKSDKFGYNTYHPSIQHNNVLWTFVDIPGEVFFNAKQYGTDMATLTSNPKLQMSLKCHAFILTADQDIVNDSIKRNNALDTFGTFINFAEEFNPNLIKGTPLVFALTKVDEVTREEERQKLPPYCIADSYSRRYRTELSIIRNKGLGSFVDTLAKKNYIFATTCAPYGFPPLPADNPARDYFPTTEQKKEWTEQYLKDHPQAEPENVPHPVYESVKPKNVGLIMDWMEKLFGAKDIQLNGEDGEPWKVDLSRASRYDGHFDDKLVSAIASMFCNPSEWDERWYKTLGEGAFFKGSKQNRIIRDYNNAQRKQGR